MCVSAQVSKKALKLLAEVEREPLLNLELLNPELVRHSESMAQAHRLRERLRLLGDYLLTCRSGACKKLQARCVCICVCVCLYLMFYYNFFLTSFFLIVPDWSSGRTCWSRAICTVSRIYDRYPPGVVYVISAFICLFETS